ncbi:MAG: hypothetical protein OXC19_19440 [Bryobacterales bacterium]|nr:hypothetical protein [Bryobacterales bacterium]
MSRPEQGQPVSLAGTYYLNWSRELIEQFTLRERLSASVNIALAARAIGRARRLRPAQHAASGFRPQAHASSSRKATGGGPDRAE